MNKLLSVLALTVVAACGQATAPSSSLNSLDNKPVDSERFAFALDGEISAVTVGSAQEPASGLWTDIEITYNVPCTQRFETFAATTQIDADGNVKVLASAIGSAAPIPLDAMVCQAFSVESRIVTVPGIVSADAVELVNLKAPSKKIPAATDALVTTAAVDVVSLSPLCPEGSVCVMGGTIVRLAVHLGCVDSLGPVTYAATQDFVDGQLGKLELAVHAINFANDDSAVVRCFVENVQYVDVTLPNMYVSNEAFEMTVLR